VVPVPDGSAGITQTGADGTFKDYVLSQGKGLHGLAALDAITEPFGTACSAVPTDLVLKPGDTVTGTASWTPGFRPEVPLQAGTLTATATFSYDPLPLPTPSPTIFADGMRAPTGMMVEQYHHLTAQATVVVAASSATVPGISAAQAVDAALTAPTFASWLEAQPQSTWVGADLYQSFDGWHVELFVQPRAFALANIDPITGAVRFVDICTAPGCDR
jgi:hypothetical protein